MKTLEPGHVLFFHKKVSFWGAKRNSWKHVNWLWPKFANKMRVKILSGEKPMTRHSADCPWSWMNVGKSTILANQGVQWGKIIGLRMSTFLKKWNNYWPGIPIKELFLSVLIGREVCVQIVWVVWLTNSWNTAGPLYHPTVVTTLFPVVEVIQPKDTFCIFLITLDSLKDCTIPW